MRSGQGNGPDRGNRIDNRARGNAAQLHEKYRNLARDMQTQGDRVMTEYYLQFADHYFRVLGESRQRFEEQQQQRRPRDDNDYDDGDADGLDEGYEGERAGRGEQQGYRPEPQPFRGEQQGYQPRGYDQPPRQRPPEPAPTRAAEPSSAEPPAERQAPDTNAPQLETARTNPAPSEDGGEAPRRRRGRRRTEPAGEAVAESADAGAPQRIDVDRLPPAFAPDPPDDGEPAAEAPRRRRRTKADDSNVAA